MNYATIKPTDIANGPGIRVSLFVSGCRNRCKGCFNQETWDFDYGYKFMSDTLCELDKLLNNPYIDGLSILGGDPFEPENRDVIEAICEFVWMWNPSKTIWIWTGYKYEDLKDLPVMQYIDVLVDGPFVEELKDLRLAYCGSSNQRVIDVSASRRAGEIVEWRRPDITKAGPKETEKTVSWIPWRDGN